VKTLKLKIISTLNNMTNIFHHIKAILIPNLLTEALGDFHAKVISERTPDINDICASAVNRWNAPTTEKAMKTIEIVDNKSSEPVIVIPQLELGLYPVKVITRFLSGCALLKEPCSVTFDKTLNVFLKIL
jgi:hypothetical protein